MPSLAFILEGHLLQHYCAPIRVHPSSVRWHEGIRHVALEVGRGVRYVIQGILRVGVSSRSQTRCPRTQTSSSSPIHSARSSRGLSSRGILLSTLQTRSAARSNCSRVGFVILFSSLGLGARCAGGVWLGAVLTPALQSSLYQEFQLCSHLASTHFSDFSFGVDPAGSFPISRKYIISRGCRFGPGTVRIKVPRRCSASCRSGCALATRFGCVCVWRSVGVCGGV